MSELLTLQDLANGHLDVKALGEAANGDENTIVTTRTGNTYPSVKKAIKTMFDNGGFPATPFDTKAKMTIEGASLVDGDYAWVTDDTDANNGLYIKRAGAWAFSEFNVLKRVQDYVKRLDAKVMLEDAIYLDVATDKNGGAYRYTDAESNLHVAGKIYAEGKELGSSNNQALEQIRYQGILAAKPTIKSLTRIAGKSDADGLNKRMIFGIKTTTGLVCFYHKQIEGFTGDGQGSELWKSIITIDNDLNAVVTSKELFLAPTVSKGVVKHPTLGRTSDGRILLVYETRTEMTDPYVQYQCYSSDEGLTFTAATQVIPNGTNPRVATGESTNALGTTGLIETGKDGRLLAPMYTPKGHCFVIYSDNDGATWTFSDYLRPFTGVEPSVIMDFDGNLLMDIRPLQANAGRWRAISYDNGLSWSRFETSKLPSPPNQGTLFKDESIGALIQTHNNRMDSSRTKYSWSISYDNNKTYPYIYQLYADDWYGGYSQIIKLKDGVYALLIEYHTAFWGANEHENVGVVVLTLSEVLSNVSHN